MSPGFDRPTIQAVGVVLPLEGNIKPIWKSESWRSMMKKTALALLVLALLALGLNGDELAEADRVDSKNLVLHYTFDKKFKFADDRSRTESVGEINGAAYAKDGQRKVLAFDGVNDYVRIPDSDSLDITGDLTVEVWIKTTQKAEAWPTIFGNCQEVSPHFGYKVGMTVDGRAFYYSQGQYVYSKTKINTGTWRHVVLTVSKNQAIIYVDGKIDHSGVVTMPRANEVDQTIGASYSPHYFFEGAIDELRVYDAALSDRQIRQHYKAGID